MKWGVFIVLALAVWPAWAEAQGPAGAAPANPPARPEQTDRMQFSWAREGGDCRDLCRAWIAASGRLAETSAADFEAFVHGGARVCRRPGGRRARAGLRLPAARIGRNRGPDH